MKIDEFINNVKLLNIDITDNELNQLNIYKDFLILYNTHTNLTAITNEEDIYLKHFYDSLTIMKACNLKEINSLLDIGTGAGFPGMVLKIFFPNLEVTLLDSNNKKTTFLKELANKLKIDVNIINARVEDFAKDNLNKFDIVTSRAVANLRVLSELSLPLVKENGYFIPLKGYLDDTLEDSRDTIEIMNGKIIDIINFSLYKDNGIRNIVIVKKVKKSTLNCLRRYDRIVKKPLQKKHK